MQSEILVVFEEEGTAAPSGSAPADAKPVMLVPLDAVVQVGGERGVFVLERDRVKFRKLALGAERSGKAVVESGLSDGDRIVVGAPARLESGDRVKSKDGT